MINILLSIIIILISISIHTCQRRIDDFKAIGLGDYKFAGNLSFDGIWIYKSRLRWVDLTKVDIADKLCQVNYESFDKCIEDYHNVKVMMSTDRSDMIPRKLKGSIDMYTNISFDERMTVPYAPNLYAVKNVFLNSWVSSSSFYHHHHQYYHYYHYHKRVLYLIIKNYICTVLVLIELYIIQRGIIIYQNIWYHHHHHDHYHHHHHHNH